MRSTGSNGRNTLATYVYPVMGEMPVADIGTAHVLKILEPIWKDKPETASRIRGRIETVLDAAKARDTGRAKTLRAGVAISPKSCLPGPA